MSSSRKLFLFWLYLLALAVIVSIWLPWEAHARNEALEVEYLNEEIFKGETQQRLPDGTEVDILTKGLAIEVDFASKWAEGIGQCIHYALQTGKEPCLVLLIEKDTDYRHINRAKEIAKRTVVIINNRPVQIEIYATKAQGF